MAITLETALALEALDAKLREILPEPYQDNYEEVLPVSMGSAGLKYGLDGRVAWDEMWATFCDLAMAGGPPHRGTLLEPASVEDAAAAPEKLQNVLNEICRGITLVTGLSVQPAAREDAFCGVRVECRNGGMAGWLVRAIVMENILAHHDATILFLPGGPEFRLGKEIKNVITVIAKTCHYWTDHMPADQQEAVHNRIANFGMDSNLLEPASIQDILAEPDTYRNVLGEIQREITERTGSVCFPNRYAGWIGVECPNAGAAIWLMRAMVVENVLARREEGVLFLPVHPRFACDGRAAQLIETFVHAHRLHALAR